MTLRRLSSLLIRTLPVVAAAMGIVLITAFDSRHARPAAADPAFGTVKINPTQLIVIQGHQLTLPVQFTSCADPLTFTGTATGGNHFTLTDTSQNWTTNQWANYAVDLTAGIGSPQTQKIVSNTNNTLTVAPDWGSSVWAGSASTGTSTTLTDYSVQPGEWFANQWVNYLAEMLGPAGPETRTVVSSTPNSVTVSPGWTVFASGSATSGDSQTLTDLSKSWTPNQYANQTVELLTGSGAIQSRTILSNTTNSLTVASPWAPAGTGRATGGSTATLVDTSVNWIPNEWAGRIIDLTQGISSPQTATILSNTNNTLTVTAPWATGTTGTATSGSTTTLTDTGATWPPNQWASMTLELTSGAGSPQTATILSNTTNTITLAAPWGGASPASGTGYTVRKSPAPGTTYGIRGYFGSATGGGATTITDTSANWLTNEWANYSIDIVAGPGNPQARTVLSNTSNTITVSAAWTVQPGPSSVGAGSSYILRRAPAAGTSYQVREGPATSSSYQLRAYVPPISGTSDRVSQPACYLGGYGVTISYPSAKFSVVSDGGGSTGANTPTTFNDTTKVWKINQWVGTQINIRGGAGLGQKRTVVSNTANQLVVTPAWSSTPPTSQPTTGSLYNIGGMTDGGFLASTGRPLSCPIGAVLGTGTAELHCTTSGLTPTAATGAGNLVALSVSADGRGISSFNLTTAQVLQIDGTTIPADVLTATRRVILCPDSNGNGSINSTDLQQTAVAFGQKGPPLKSPADPLYTPAKDPDENGLINSTDLQLTASVFGKKCIQA